VAPAGEADPAGVVEPPDPGPRRLGEPFDAVAGLLEDELAPDVDAQVPGPAAVDVLDVDLVVDVHELEQVEEEERDVGVGAGRDVGHRRHAADAGVELAEVQLAGVEVGEVVDLEEAAVALNPQPVAELLGEDPRRSRCSGERASG
jgi:hypothetical protein